MIALKVTQIGNSVGIVLPKDALIELGVAKGATLYLTRAPDGAMRVSPYDDSVQQQIALRPMPSGLRRTAHLSMETSGRPFRR